MNTRKLQTIAFVALAVASLFALAMHTADRKAANMNNYAAAHDCQWQDNGTFYGDDRDYTCK